MQGKFEKDIEQQFSGFSLVPSEQVWEEVEAALYPRRKRRLIIWWWFIGGLALAGGGWWLLLSPSKEIKNTPQTISTVKQESKLTVPEKNTTQLPANTPAIVQQKNANNIKSLLTKNKTKDNTANAPLISKKISSDVFVNKTTVINEVPVQQQKNVVTPEQKITNNKITADSSTKIIADNIPAQTIVNDPKSTNVQKNTDTLATIKDSTVVENKKDSTTPAKNNAAKENKHKWLLTAGGGILSITGSGLFSSAPTPQSFIAAPVPGGGTSTQVPAANSGYHFFAGIVYQKPISNNWLFSSGLQYHYLQNKQPVGVDSLLGGVTYFAIGNTSTKINYSHWLQLPFSLGYSIHVSPKSQIQLLGGGSIAWAFSENWLITNTSTLSRSYYYNSSLNNNLIFTLRAGMGYNFNDRLTISILAEQSLATIQQRTNTTSYWRLFSLQASKPLSSFSRKQKPSKHN